MPTKKNPQEKSRTRLKQSEAASPITVKAPVIDRLVFVLPWNVGFGVVQPIPEDVKERIHKAIEKDKCTLWYGNGGRYRSNLRVKMPSGARAQIGLGAKNGTQKGALRIDITPSKMEVGDAEYLHRFLRYLLRADDYDGLLHRAYINRMDMAVDIVNCRLDQLLVHYKGVHELTVFSKRFCKSQAETFNFGSVSSPYREAVYKKDVQLTHEAVEELIKNGAADPLRENLIRQLNAAKKGPPIVRIEIRGMKMGGVNVHALKGGSKKRFERFLLADLSSLSEVSDFTKANFMALSREIGLKPAVEAYKACPDRDERKVIKGLLESPPAWWAPEGLWVKGIKALKQSGIFPKSAFKEKHGH
ncbi:hypothetical protein [Variovorax sp. 38R]|uniref:hypothetical protein n=1 Tax=Variovorax sp. 38R TaxID=2774875 RepID=UPI001785EBCB|nr:hypothetical protein [Variovorax sp. 38R]QOF77565.1 hypothetical protein IG196_24965 [Variovorax sp. 38R]